jgi:hypothetical protein
MRALFILCSILCAIGIIRGDWLVMAISGAFAALFLFLNVAGSKAG